MRHLHRACGGAVVREIISTLVQGSNPYLYCLFLYCKSLSVIIPTSFCTQGIYICFFTLGSLSLWHTYLHHCNHIHLTYLPTFIGNLIKRNSCTTYPPHHLGNPTKKEYFVSFFNFFICEWFKS